MAQRQPPRFVGVDTYLDPLGRFQFRFPTDWRRFEQPDREGVLFSPPVGDPYTSFSAWISKLDESVVAEDLDDLRIGVNEGLAQLPNCQVESEYEAVLSNLIKFERVFTFRENGAVRKRKQWLLYVDTWLIVLTWQGSTPEEYAYWLPMGNYAFATFNLPEALWFATDRDLSGYKVTADLASHAAFRALASAEPAGEDASSLS